MRQLRGGFAGRGAGVFPISIALVGMRDSTEWWSIDPYLYANGPQGRMRDLKDYITASKGGVPVNPGSLLMAFLQRITNGSGRIEREYAAGRGRMDLAIEYKGAWNIIEIKLLRTKQSFETVRAEGIKQILQYRGRIDPAAPCYLVIFDRCTAAGGPWEGRLTWEDAGEVTVVGC